LELSSIKKETKDVLRKLVSKKHPTRKEFLEHQSYLIKEAKVISDKEKI
jgi:hypothetical protein